MKYVLLVILEAPNGQFQLHELHRIELELACWGIL